MDRKSKILVIVFLTIILISAVATYWRTIVAHDYPVVNTAPAS